MGIINIQLRTPFVLMSDTKAEEFKEQEPLDYHSHPIAGKYRIECTKPMNN